MSERALFPHTSNDRGLHTLCCNACGKPVSTWFVPLATDTPDRGLIVRAIIHCPECFETLAKALQDDVLTAVVREETTE